MKTTSADYKTAMAEDMRGAAYCKIGIQNINYDAADDASSWSITTGNLAFGSGSDWEDSLNDPNYAYQTFATLELNRWVLDSSQRPVYDSSLNNGGYVSDIMSDSAGDFGTKPTIERTYTDAYSTPNVNVSFDNVSNEYPITVSFKYVYDNNGTPTTVGPTQYTITSSEYAFPTHEADGTPRDVSYIYLRAVKSLPYRRFRIRTVWFGTIVEFDNDVIQEVVQTNDVDPLSRRLPQNDLSFSIIDFDGVWDMENPSSFVHYLYDRVPVYVQYGMTLADDSVEWLSPDYYYIVSNPTWDNGIASFEAVGILNAMTDSCVNTTAGFTGVTYHSLAQEVLEDADLPLTADGLSAWDISTMNDGTTTRVPPIATHAELLQIVAHATRNRLSTNDKNQIVIEPFTYVGLTPNGYQLDYDSVSINTQNLSMLDMLHNCNVHYYPFPLVYQPTENPITYIVVQEESLGVARLDYDVVIEDDAWYSIYPDPDMVRNGIVDDWFGTAHHLTMTLNSLRASPGMRIGVWGTPAPATQDNIFEKAVNMGGVDDVEENPLIDKIGDASDLADHVSGYLQLRRTYDMEYRGDPALETGDVIEVQVKYTNTLQKAYVLCNELSYNGAFHGKVTVKILDN